MFLVLTMWPPRAGAQAGDVVLPDAAEAELSSLAARASVKLKTPWVPSPVVAVFDFTTRSSDRGSILGRILADRFSEMLKQQGNGIQLLNRETVQGYLKRFETDPEDMRIGLVYFEFAKDVDATDAIRAELSEGTDHILTISLERTGFSAPFRDQAQLPMSPEMEQAFETPRPSNHRSPETIPAETDAIVLGSGSVEGVEPPHCIRCPNPNFSERARKTHFVAGRVVLSGLVTLDGKVDSIYVLQGMPLGLTEAAVAAVQNWKLTPAIKQGSPVRARVDIEIEFKTTPPNAP